MKIGKAILCVLIVSMLVSMALPMVSAPKPPKPPPNEPPADPAISYFFQTSGPNPNRLMVMNDDGSNQATIYEGYFSPSGKLSWSPDGDAIAWAGRITGYDGKGVWRIDVDVVDGVPQGSNLQRLVDESASGDDVHCAAWSPLGDEIAYASRHATSNNWFIKVVPATGGDIETIYESHEMAINLQSLTWSSDGTRIAFVAIEGPGTGLPTPWDTYIAIMERETGTVTHTLLKGEFQYIWIEWARGFDTLLMKAGDPAPTRIYTVDIEDPTPVVILEEGTSPCWSPDNTKFVYITLERRKSGIAVFDLETGESERLVNGGSRPDWRRCETVPP